MSDGLLGDPVTRALSFTLNGLSRRQEVVSNNVSNVDTPGFQTSSVPFEAQLKTAMNRDPSNALFVTNPAHIQPRPPDLTARPQVATTHGQSSRPAGSDADI